MFKPFDKILVRNNHSEIWHIGIFSHCKYYYHVKENEIKYVTIDGKEYEECIPYEGFEDLTSTNKEANFANKNKEDYFFRSMFFVRRPDYKVENINNCVGANKELIFKRHLMFNTREEAEEYATELKRCSSMTNEDFKSLKLGEYWGYC